MLKMMYTDTGIHIEQIAQTVDGFIAARSAFAATVGQTLICEAGRAAFLVNASASAYAVLTRIVDPMIGVCVCDVEFIEVSVAGFWMAVDTDSESGIFVAAFDRITEADLMMIWNQSSPAFSMSD
jgi:hypothetical protein